MSSDVCLALLLDGPMQSWGHASRFGRRTTALHPTRSGVLGLIAAAMGIDKHGTEEANHMKCFASLQLTTVTLMRTSCQNRSLPMRRLEDYHTVTGIRRASGKVAVDATVLTYRHYLLDARFGVLLDGPVAVLVEIANALSDPKWGIWLGRKSCVPASPVLAAGPGPRSEVWEDLLERAGLSTKHVLGDFDHVVETEPGDHGADMIEDYPIGFGRPIGERHTPRWIRRVSKSINKNP
ncbi:MAG: type I-E CRISPR-associated protein Cas5/CasD [Verrucomicrobiota bacterium]